MFCRKTQHWTHYSCLLFIFILAFDLLQFLLMILYVHVHNSAQGCNEFADHHPLIFWKWLSFLFCEVYFLKFSFLSVKIQDVQLFSDHLVVCEREDGLPKIIVYGLPAVGEPLKGLDGGQAVKFFDPIYSSYPSESEFSSGILRFSYSSMKTPPSIYDYDMKTGISVLKKIETVSHIKMLPKCTFVFYGIWFGFWFHVDSSLDSHRMHLWFRFIMKNDSIKFEYGIF